MKHKSYLLLWCAVFYFSAVSVSSAQSPVVQTLEKNWKFTRENAPNAEKIDYNDNYWSNVSIPHTWNALDGQDGGNDYYRGTGWYRTSFVWKPHGNGKRCYIKFDGVATVATVYVNGNATGTHKGNFGAFCFDVTPFVNAGKKNILAVKVNNARDTTVAPLRGDFTVFGGIYRPVHVLTLNAVSFSPLDYASDGVYVIQRAVSAERATFDISAVIQNISSNIFTGICKVTVFDLSKKSIADTCINVELAKGISKSFTQTMTINNPHLWNGTKDPYQYSIKVELYAGKSTVDSRLIQTGFRFYSIDPNNGFSLNGYPYKIYGVNRHQDRFNKGWAISQTDMEEDFSIIKDMGTTAVRLAHYQHASEAYSICDQKGLIVWAELPLVDDVNESPQFLENCKQQLNELIKQNINHPSIFFWSLENELVPDKDTALYTRIVAELNQLAKSHDPSRKTTAATRSKYDGGFGMNRVSDVLGVNVYRGWYEKKPEDFGAFIDEYHGENPVRCLAISEYGAGAGINQHEFPPQKPSPRGQWHPEEWQSYLHEVTWKQIAQRKFLWGSFIWNMFDFAVDNRSEGELLGRNDKGLVTYDRKVKKDAYYFYQANWSDKPMIHIASKRFNPRPHQFAQIKAYSNCSEVTLLVNGNQISTLQNTGNIFVWENLTFNAGKNRIIAKGRRGKIETEDEFEFEYLPEKLTENK